MKATTVTGNDFMHAPVVRYPNAATRRQVFHKVLDFLVMLAAGAGIAAILLFILAVV